MTENLSEYPGIRTIGFLFDLDGVLIDSERKYTQIWSKINHAYPTGVAEFEYKIKGSTLERILDSYFAESVRPDVVRMLYEEERKMVYEYCPGACRLLTVLKENDIPVALVTSSNEKKMSHLREELPGFEDFFDAVIVGDMVSRSKPDPEGYLLGARRLDVSPSRCVVIEDSLQGVRAGRAAGAYVIGVAGTLKASDLLPFSDRVIDSLDEIDLPGLVDILLSRG